MAKEHELICRWIEIQSDKRPFNRMDEEEELVKELDLELKILDKFKELYTVAYEMFKGMVEEDG